MKPNTTPRLATAVLAAALVGLSASAIAQNTAAPAADPHAHHKASSGGATSPAEPTRRADMRQKMADRHAQHLAQLKAALQLTAAQEPAWKAFIARTEPTPPQAQTAAEDWSKLTTPQRLDRMQALHNERNTALAQRIEATRSFYAQLTPEQQKTFDAQGLRLHRMGMMGEHRMGGQDGQPGGKPGKADKGGGMGCGHGGGSMGSPGPRS